MNDTLQTLLRSILKIGAGALVAHGLANSETAEIITAGFGALFGVVWGIVHRSSGQSQPVNITKVSIAIAFAGCLALAPIGCQSARVASFKTIAAVEEATTQSFSAYIDLVATGQLPTNDVPKVAAAFNMFQLSVRQCVDLFAMTTNSIAPDEVLQDAGAVTAAINAAKQK